MVRRSRVLASCVLALAVLNACSPSYREDQLISEIARLCADEYHYQVTARKIGQTIAVHLHHPGILHQEQNQIGLAPDANEILGNIIEVVHRVTLSSDATVKFYLLLVSDPAVPGAYLTVVRYVDDVRRANASIIPPTELFSRTILELKYVGVPAITLDQITLNDIRLEQFLSWQLSKRIQTKLSDTLQRRGMPLAELGPCAGEFRNGEFVFTLNVTPRGVPFKDEQVQQIFQDATSVIAQVLSGYRFNDFTTVRLIHPPTGRNLLLPKTRLDLFR